MKNGRNEFWGTPLPPKNNLGGVQNFLSKMKKIKVVKKFSKSREIWSKTIFGILAPAPQKNHYLEGVQFFF